VEKALQELFPLFSFEQRFWFFGVNLVPPESNDESENIIPYFTGGANAILRRMFWKKGRIGEPGRLEMNPET
jgi:hypothetical protein